MAILFHMIAKLNNPKNHPQSLNSIVYNNALVLWFPGLTKSPPLTKQYVQAHRTDSLSALERPPLPLALCAPAAPRLGVCLTRASPTPAPSALTRSR